MAIPGMAERVAMAESFLARGGQGPGAEAARAILNQAKAAQTNPTEVAKVVLRDETRQAVENAMFDNKAALNQKQELINQLAQFLTDKGVPSTEIKAIVDTQANKTYEQIKTNLEAENSLFGKIVNFAITTGISASIPGTGPQMIAQSVYSLAQGAKPEDVVKNIVASVAADKVPGFLKDVNKTIVNSVPELVKPTVKSALVNAQRQATAALITKQDIGQAALAGAVGGAVADATGVATDDKAIARAAGQYIQAKVAGLSEQDALMYATSGFISEEEKLKAQQKIAALPLEQVGAMGFQRENAPSDADVVDIEEGRSLPPVTVTGQRISDPQILNLMQRSQGGTTRKITEKELPTVTVEAKRDTEEENILDLIRSDLGVFSTERDTEEKRPEGYTQQDVILLDLLSGTAGAVPQRQVKTNSVPRPQDLAGMQALSQALQIGDPGEPLFGARRGKRSNIWNVESLKLKDELGG